MHQLQPVAPTGLATEASPWLEMLFGSAQPAPEALPARKYFKFETKAWASNPQVFEKGDRVVFSDVVPTKVVEKLGVSPDSPVVVLYVLNEDDADTVVCLEERTYPTLGVKTCEVTFPEPMVVGVHFATQQLLQIPVSCARNLDR